MVAITVILAAVIGAFVLGFGGGGPSAPSVTWETTDDGNNVTFSHGGGDTIDDPAVLSVSQGTKVVNNGGTSGLQTGDSVVAQGAGSGTTTLIWESPDSDSTQELASHDI
jgi:FlaG/FlaF family flagellin (archaellin)